MNIRVHTSLSTRTFITSPRAITPAILEFCTWLNPEAQPVWVPVLPDPDAQPRECFFNVRARVERDGGELLNGLAIWQWPRVMLEAEHHAVWRHDGKLIDVTPQRDRERKILFLPHPELTFDFNRRTQITNERRSLGQMVAAQWWLDTFDEADRADMSIPGMFEHIEARKQHAYMQLLGELKLKVGPHERCICTSGKEFRKCCGKLIQIG